MLFKAKQTASYIVTRTFRQGLTSFRRKRRGFATYTQNGIVMEVDSNPQINVTMKVGAVSESVEVNAQAAMVETHSNAIGQVIDQQRVVDLPLNGRQITDLASLSGATLNLNNIMASGGTTQATALVPNRNYPTDAAISIAGGGGGKTNYMLDGTLNFDIVTGAGLPFPFPDALQEFKLETSSLPASAGQLPGGVVNVVTKSGTNTIHGTLFEFLRNYDLDAPQLLCRSERRSAAEPVWRRCGRPRDQEQAVLFRRLSGHQRLAGSVRVPDLLQYRGNHSG